MHRLRTDSGWMPTLSLVAEDHDRVVGHVCLTRAGVGPFPVLALGPIGVLPEHQRAGVGSGLMHAALGAADALDEPLVGLLGSLRYYPRFGFVPGGRLGVVPDEPSWASHFQVRPLSAYESGITGEFHYPGPVLRHLSCLGKTRASLVGSVRACPRPPPTPQAPRRSLCARALIPLHGKRRSLRRWPT